jgi:tetratricopeptide (TPR) repeat protein
LTQFSEIISGHIHAGYFKEAIDYADKEIARNPSSSEAFEYRGIAKYMMMYIDEAFEDLNKAISLDNNNHKALSNRANIYRDRQEYEQAISDYKLALSIAPENLYYKTSLAHIYLVLKDYQNCLNFAGSVLNVEPINYYGLYYSAVSFHDIKNYKEAIACYKILLTHYPPTWELYNNLAFSQTYNNELKAAKDNFQKAIDADIYAAYPYDNLGYVFYLEKNYPIALELINKSIELDPSNSWAFKNRALVYIALGKIDSATSDLNYALELGYSKIYDNEVETLLKNISK